MTRRIIIAIFLLFPIFGYADYNGVGIKIAFGYHDAMAIPTKNENGIATSLNLAYEYNKQHFLFQIGTGIHYSYHDAHLQPHQGTFQNMIDEDGDMCNYGYVFDNRHDNACVWALDVPILLGGQWNYMYFLVGGKAQYSFKGKFKEQASLKTFGEYPNLIDYLENMPNHNYWEDVVITSQQRFALPLALHVSAEIGIDLFALLPYRPQTQNKVINRLALYGECAINNLLPQAENNLYNFHLQDNEIPDIQQSNITMQHCYKAKDSNIAALRFWEVGLRYTFLLAIPSRNQQCHCGSN